MIAKDDDLVFDVTGNNSHRVPYWRDFIFHCNRTPTRLRDERVKPNDAPRLTNRIVVASLFTSSSSLFALFHEMGKLGMLGKLAASIRVTFAYEGNPGVVGSPG